jgi:hypothetical protein
MFMKVVKMAIERRTKGLPPLVPRGAVRNAVPSLEPIADTKESTLLAGESQEESHTSARRLMCVTPFLSPLDHSPTTRAGESLDSITFPHKSLPSDGYG